MTKPKTATKTKAPGRLDDGQDSELISTAKTDVAEYELRRYATRLVLLRGWGSPIEWRIMAELYGNNEVSVLHQLFSLMAAHVAARPLPNPAATASIKFHETPESREQPPYINKKDLFGQPTEISGGAQSDDKIYEAYRDGEAIDLVVGYPEYTDGVVQGIDRFKIERMHTMEDVKCLFSVLCGVLGYLKREPLARDRPRVSKGKPGRNPRRVGVATRDKRAATKNPGTTVSRGPDGFKSERKKAPKRTVFIVINELAKGGYLARPVTVGYSDMSAIAASKNDAFEALHEALKKKYPTDQVITKLDPSQQRNRGLGMQATGIVGKAPKAGAGNHGRSGVARAAGLSGKLAKAKKTIVIGADVTQDNGAGGLMFVAQTDQDARSNGCDVASQGRTVEKALKNLKEAVELKLGVDDVEIKQRTLSGRPVGLLVTTAGKPAKTATNAPGRKHASKPAKVPSRGKASRL